MGTLRQQMKELLRTGCWSSMELSQELSIQEREVFSHLEHVRKSLRKERLSIKPYCCQSCGYEFKKRKRFDRPGRCPVCRESHIKMALFSIE